MPMPRTKLDYRFATLFALAAMCLCTLTPAGAAEPQSLEYPQTRRVDQVDVYHGVEVADPYRWLEEDVRTSDEVAEWVAAQNAVARSYLDALPHREKIHK